MSAKKSTAKKSPARAKAKPAAKPRNGSLDPTAKFTWDNGKPNPFKEGSGAYQRVEILRKLSGQPVAAIRGYKGLRRSTLATCVRLGLGKVA
jgi:hypothetical protein